MRSKLIWVRWKHLKINFNLVFKELKRQTYVQSFRSSNQLISNYNMYPAKPKYSIVIIWKRDFQRAKPMHCFRWAGRWWYKTLLLPWTVHPILPSIRLSYCPTVCPPVYLSTHLSKQLRKFNSQTQQDVRFGAERKLFWK